MFDPADVAEAAEAWGELADSLEESPLFPVDDFARLLRLVTPVLVDDPGWGPMVEAVDAAVARIEGGAAAGEACRQSDGSVRGGPASSRASRAASRKGPVVVGDTIRGALLSMLMLSQIYADLYLPFAAKQYALAAAGLAYTDGSDEIIEFVARGLLRASQLSYIAGDWTAAIEELEIGLMALHDLNDPEDPTTARLFSTRLRPTACASGPRAIWVYRRSGHSKTSVGAWTSTTTSWRSSKKSDRWAKTRCFKQPTSSCWEGRLAT